MDPAFTGPFKNVPGIQDDEEMATALLDNIVVTIREPSGNTWPTDTVSALSGVDGIVSFTFDAAVDPSTIIITLPNDTVIAKGIINTMASMLPGVPLHWSTPQATQVAQ